MLPARKKRLDEGKLEFSTSLLSAIAHPVRLNILRYIAQHKRVHVHSIYSNLKLEQSITSQHLRTLREQGVVEAEKEGKFVMYSLNYALLQKTQDALNKFAIPTLTDNELDLN